MRREKKKQPKRNEWNENENGVNEKDKSLVFHFVRFGCSSWPCDAHTYLDLTATKTIPEKILEKKGSRVYNNNNKPNIPNTKQQLEKRCEDKIRNFDWHFGFILGNIFIFKWI